jgi:hypothetical protein
LTVRPPENETVKSPLGLLGRMIDGSALAKGSALDICCARSVRTAEHN